MLSVIGTILFIVIWLNCCRWSGCLRFLRGVYSVLRKIHITAIPFRTQQSQSRARALESKSRHTQFKKKKRQKYLNQQEPGGESGHAEVPHHYNLCFSELYRSHLTLNLISALFYIYSLQVFSQLYMYTNCKNILFFLSTFIIQNILTLSLYLNVIEDSFLRHQGGGVG